MPVIGFRPGWQLEGEESAFVTSWREWLFIDITAGTTIPQIQNTLGYPQIGDPHPHNNNAKIRKIRPALQDSAIMYRVQLEYSTEDDEFLDDPLQESIKIERSDEVMEEPAEWDDDGYWIAPSNQQEPFDPLPVRLVPLKVLTITRNVELWDNDRENFIHGFRLSVNEDVFFGNPPGSTKCFSIVGPTDERNGLKFTRETYIFKVREPRLTNVLVVDAGEQTPTRKDILGWDDVALDIGSVYLNDDGRFVDFVTGFGNPRPNLGRLDGQGGFLPIDAENVYLRFKLKKKKVFGDLDLGSS